MAMDSATKSPTDASFTISPSSRSKELSWIQQIQQWIQGHGEFMDSWIHGFRGSQDQVLHLQFKFKT